ncbi:MAG: iron-sulfur cluster repair di-iron protein, ric [Bacilli bacterium]
MDKKISFNEAKAQYWKPLTMYVPVVNRVHGQNHPEFHEVFRLFNSMNEKVKTTHSPILNLEEEFASLRRITNHYLVPDDVCETFAAVYQMLEALDLAYHA